MRGHRRHYLNPRLLFLLTLLIISGLTAGRDIMNNIHTALPDGLIITQDQELKVQNGEWTLLITIQPPVPVSLEQAITLLRLTVNKYREDFSNSTGIHWDNRLTWISTSMRPNQSPSRRRRGLIDIGGTLLHHLFGVATDAELAECLKLVKGALSSNKRIVHATSHMMSVVRAIQNNTLSNRVAIIDMENKVHQMWSQLLTIVDTIQGAVNTLENQLRIEESINTLETFAQRYHDAYAHYLDQRAALELGYLAESILPRSYLRSILHRAMTSMVNPLNLMWYYQHSAVTPLWVGDGTLVYWTRIPLVNTAKYLLYHIQAFPVRAVNHTVTLGVNNVVAIDTQGGGIFTPRYCHGQSPIVCRTGAISRSPALSCERGIITGDKSQRRSCQITVTPTSNETIITEVQLAEYVIVTPGECFTENCPGEAMTRHCLPLGTHLITVPDLCNFHGHTWTTYRRDTRA